MSAPTRRDFLRGSLAAALVARALPEIDRPPGFEKPEIVPFVGEEDVPMDTAYGAGIDGRLNTDLSRLPGDTPVTASERFFIRTRYPEALAAPSPWSVRVEGLVRRPSELSFESLRKEAQDCGVHVLDCAGNTRRRHFGLVSAARWRGVPVARLLSQLEASRAATRLEVSGRDRLAPGGLSARDGSWTFALEDLSSTHAFLATEMNGAPVGKDHGAPLRLVVPGWYACAAVKWVDRFVLRDESAPTTPQMKEYSPHTGQSGVPAMARNFRRPVVEPAALPIRVEKGRRGGRPVYRAVGLLWGGFRSGDALTIRFDPETEARAVAMMLPGTSWTLWTHEWKAPRPATYSIELRIADAARAARLASGFYTRSIRVAEA